MAAPMPREAPDSMTTRSAGASRSDAVSRRSATISEQALVSAAVIDDVLASHESGLSAAEMGRQSDRDTLAGERKRAGSTEPVAGATHEGAAAGDVEIHRAASAVGAKEPASSRAGTLNRPAKSLSFSRSVVTSA